MDCRAEDVDVGDLSGLSLWNLIAKYNTESSLWDKQTKAEVAYALAIGLVFAAEGMHPSFKDEGDRYIADAKKFAQDCIEILKTLSSDTMAQVAPRFTVLAEVAMPSSFFHLDYVELRFRNKKLIN